MRSLAVLGLAATVSVALAACGGDDSGAAATTAVVTSATTTIATTTTSPEVTYVIQKGDSLSKIAKHEYGDANAWPKIFEANKDILKDPNKIFPGQKLKIP